MRTSELGQRSGRGVRRRVVIALATLVGACCVGLGTGCQKLDSMTISLQYRPTDLIDPMDIEPQQAFRVYVMPVQDHRDETDFIGSVSNDDSESTFVLFDEQVPPTQFVRDAIYRELVASGINNLAQLPNEADRVVSIKLERFWTHETHIYRCEIRGMVQVTDRSGVTLWQGPASGVTRRYGNAASLEEYQKSYSDATLNLIQKLLDNPSFQRAIGV